MKIFISVLMAAVLGAAQQSKPEAGDPNNVIRVETSVVLVDAVVTDKKGNYVRDLKQKDFKVWEDNKEQSIKSFTFEADPASPLNSQPRYIVLMFDMSTMNFGEQAIARKAAASFIDANSGPNRLMALVNYGGGIQIAQNFTADTERLKALVKDIKMGMGPTAADAGVGGLGRAAADFSTRNLVMGIRSLAKNLATIPGRKTLVLLTAGYKLPLDQYSDVTAAIDMCNRSNVAIYPIDVRGLVAGTPGARVQPVQESPFKLASYQGRGGAPTGGGGTGGTTGGGGGHGPAPSPGGGTGGTGTGGGGTTGGGGRGGAGSGGTPTPTNGGRGGGGSTMPVTPVVPMRPLMPKIPDSATTNQQVMYMLADGTGGFVIMNTNDLLGGMEKIAKELNEFYLIGYSPAKPEDGKETCHTIRVKAANYSVRARTGYCTVKVKDALAQTQTEKTLEGRAAATEPGNVAATMQAPYFFTGNNVARVNVAMEMPAASVIFAKDKGRMRSTINVLGIAYKGDGSVGARFSDVVKLDLANDKEVEAFQQRIYHYENQFDVAAGQYNLKVVFSSGGQNFGKLEQPLAIDPYDIKKFNISSLALSSRVVKVSESDQGLEAALVEDRTPLVAQGYQVVPSGSSIFKKTEKFAFYCEIYDPQLGGSEIPKEFAVGVQMKVFDAKGTMKFDSKAFRIQVPEKPGNPTIPFAAQVPLTDIEPGVYKLELTAVDTANNTFVRTANFQIQP
jgi:VWFA-related protein